MQQRTWHTLSADEVFQAVDSSSNGLTSSTAQTRLEEHGPNQLAAGEKKDPP